MNKENHMKITLLALQDTALHPNSIDLIAKANQDSDHQSSAASLDEQHFCAPGNKKDQSNGPLVVALCMSFIEEIMDIAAMLVRRSNQEEITHGLYFIGRALHCIQDFYAHSNWIALNQKEVWNGLASPPNLKFCGAAANKLDNSAFLYKWNAKNWFFKAARRKRVFKRIISRDDMVFHPDVHLDFKDSLGDKIITEGANIGGGSAYELAEALAVKHSQLIYAKFLMKMVSSRYHPESSYAKAKWAKYRSNLLVTPKKRRFRILKKKPIDYSSVYSKYYNEATNSAIMALENLNDHDPGEIKLVEMMNSRMIFNTYFQHKRAFLANIVETVDKAKGDFDSLIF